MNNLTGSKDEVIVLMSNTSTNATTIEWTPLAMIFTLATILSILFNGLLMVVFIYDHSLRTPFNVYLINLLIANLLCSIVQNPLEIINTISSNFWLGPQVCTLYQYAGYILQASVSGAHILIAVNRTWAVTHPISYRSIHSQVVAIALCLGMWTYIHLVLLPGILIDHLYYRMDMTKQKCFLDSSKQRTWAILIQVIVFNNPQLIMVLSLITVLVMRHIREGKKKLRRVEPAPINNTAITGISPSTSLKFPQPSQRASTNGERSSAQGTAKVVAAKRESNAYTVLGLLTISAVVCWTPLDALYTLEIFSTEQYPTFYQVAAILHAFQVVLDPIMFVVSSPNMRMNLRRGMKGLVSLLL
ncbi:hypothetical protein BV898_07064 [Hypsibius exemplaris]|uniref:G-protein coupled receptors family 1 profile domain-containing protein n=1 Tax=Hypsibius exemplaris TaxID=2072580 RepID=A0A1W0WUH4_HYPEX|nr:hypothetical protein BV898_07064 [Hypsibius exemplaris]